MNLSFQRPFRLAPHPKRGRIDTPVLHCTTGFTQWRNQPCLRDGVRQLKNHNCGLQTLDRQQSNRIATTPRKLSPYHMFRSCPGSRTERQNMLGSIFVFSDLHLGRPGAPGFDWALQELETAASPGATTCVCLGDIIDRNADAAESAPRPHSFGACLQTIRRGPFRFRQSRYPPHPGLPARSHGPWLAGAYLPDRHHHGSCRSSGNRSGPALSPASAAP